MYKIYFCHLTCLYVALSHFIASGPRSKEVAGLNKLCQSGVFEKGLRKIFRFREISGKG